jgi:hypothetical protein
LEGQVITVIPKESMIAGFPPCLCSPRLLKKSVTSVGTYLDPPDRAPLLSVDEKSQIQALDGTAHRADDLRLAERRTHHYVGMAHVGVVEECCARGSHAFRQDSVNNS